jgi:outer membrane protein insertion porin family
MLVSGTGFGQTGVRGRPSPKAARWPIASLRVEGNQRYTREQILAVIRLKIGQMAGRAEFDAARDRLVATGAFEKVEYKFTPATGGQGYSGVFQVSEIQQVYPVSFEGLGVSSKDLAASLAARDPLFSREGLAATQPVIERYTRWIQEYLAAHGVKEKIAGSVEPADPGDFAIVFQPEVTLPAVAEVTFEGNHVIEEKVLREAVSLPAIGSPYTEDNFRQVLKMSIRPLYEARGRVRVSFPALRTEPVKDVKGVHVFVTVDEGESYELGKVSIDGRPPLPAQSLLKAGDFKTGDLANMERVNQGLERIRKAVARAGYINAKVTSDHKIDDEKKAVDVTVLIDPGQQFTMGKLNVVGLDLEGEAAMKRIWGLQFGKPFNPEYPDQFLKRVHDEAMFDNLGQTKSAVKMNDDRSVDVTLTFAGSGPQTRPGRRRSAVED